MANLVVRVGAAVDRSVDTAFKSVIASARAAERTSSAIEAQATRVARVEAGKQADAHVKATERWMATRARIMANSAAMVGRAAAKEVASEKRAADAKVASAERAEKLRVAAAERAEKMRTAVAERESKKREAIITRESRAVERDQVKRFNKTYSSGRGEREQRIRAYGATASTGILGGLSIGKDAAMRAASFTARAALDVARGAGVNTDLASHFAANTSLESQAVDVSNSGYMVGDPRNNKRVGPGDLVRQARNVGKDTAFDPSAILGGLQAFAGKTGDLQTGRDVIKDLAVLSKATGTNLEDMVSASGDVANALGDIPDKGAAISRVMKSIAGQGKLGAVEIKDLAVQMAKVAAASSKFEGSSESNLAILGGFAQEARAHGGAASATQAATSTQGFADTFAKGARFEAFKAEVIDVNSATEKGKYRDPRELIVEALQKTKGDMQRMNKMFASATAQRVTGGFATVFNDAQNRTSGTEQEKLAAGTAAVRAEMEKLTSAAMGEGEIRESFNAAMNTSASKAEIFNTKVGEMAGQLQTAALPQLEKLGPVLLPLIPALGGLLVPTIKLGTAFATAIARLTGADGAQDDAQHNETTVAVDDIAAKVANGTLTNEDVDALQKQRPKLEQDLAKRKKKLEAAGDYTAFDFLDDANPFSDSVNDRMAGANAAKANVASAELDLNKLDRTMQQVLTALTSGKVRVIGEPAGPRAPGGPDVKKPMAAK